MMKKVKKSTAHKPPAEPGEEQGPKDKILQESTRLFAQHGFEGTSLQMIADATGLQKGSLVYYYKTKDQIREAVLGQIVDRWRDILPNIILTASTGENRFDRMIAECTRFFRQDPNRARFLLHECLDRPSEIEGRITVQVSPWLALLTERITLGQKEGIIFKDVDPLIYVWQVVLQIISTTAIGAIAGGIIGGKKMDDRMEAELIRMARTSLFLKPQKGGRS